MKKLLAAALAALFALSLAGCGTPAASASTAETAGQPVELVVFAAASLTETLTEIADTYEAAHPGVTLTFNFDSSGTLKTQVEEGAACDVFLSAAEKQLDQLEELGAGKRRHPTGPSGKPGDPLCTGGQSRGHPGL